MAVEVIEGTLEPAQPPKLKRGYARYPALRFTLPGGTVRTVDKVAAGGVVVGEVARGGPGRYFLARADGANALIGVRRADGAAHYAHYQNAEPIVLIGGIIGILVGIARFTVVPDLPLTPAVLGPLLLLGWLYLRNQRLGQRRFFDANAG